MPLYSYNKEMARRHTWVDGANLGLCQAEQHGPLSTGHDTEKPDSKQHMILITSSTYGLTSTAAANTE